MKETSAIAAAEFVQELPELIAELDLRVPQVERADKVSIARDGGRHPLMQWYDVIRMATDAVEAVSVLRSPYPTLLVARSGLPVATLTATSVTK